MFQCGSDLGKERAGVAAPACNNQDENLSLTILVGINPDPDFGEGLHLPPFRPVEVTRAHDVNFNDSHRLAGELKKLLRRKQKKYAAPRVLVFCGYGLIHDMKPWLVHPHADVVPDTFTLGT